MLSIARNYYVQRPAQTDTNKPASAILDELFARAPDTVTPAWLIAHLEEDGLLLIVAMASALASLAVTGATVWAAIRTTGWLDRLL